jgi:hypothetical protein
VQGIILLLLFVGWDKVAALEKLLFQVMKTVIDSTLSKEHPESHHTVP